LAEGKSEDPEEKQKISKALEGEMEKLSPKLGLGIW